MRCSLLLVLLWSLVEVHCQQTFPYVSFMGQNLANHSYVNISLVGSASNNSDGVLCHTDLSTCCSGVQGSHREVWYFPDGTRPASVNNRLGEARGAQVVVIRHISGIGPSGIYRCDIAVHHETDISVRELVYVGLYPAYGGNGKVPIFYAIN